MCFDARIIFAKWITSDDYRFALSPELENSIDGKDTYIFRELTPIVKAIVTKQNLDFGCYFDLPQVNSNPAVDFNFPPAAYLSMI